VKTFNSIISISLLLYSIPFYIVGLVIGWTYAVIADGIISGRNDWKFSINGTLIQRNNNAGNSNL